MYRLFEQVEKERDFSINFLNLREVFLSSYDDFIDTFFKSTESDNGIKTGVRRQYSLFGLFKLDAFTERMLRKKKEDPFLVMEREFQRLQKKNIQPVVIIDEFHKLDGLYMPDRQKRLMVELMNFFVAMTKESHLCHVIIASSDAFFIEQVYVDTKLRKTSKFMKLDYLERDDVFEWLSDIRKYNKVKEYTLDREQIELIWDTVGGSAWEIYSILEDMFLYPLEEIVARIKREKVAMIADWVDCDEIEERQALLKRFASSNKIDRRKLTGLKALLGQAVKDNILHYDPVDGIYSIQGRSLEWGIKGYFGE
jgi:AAA+ ATPase superfamily predicted ATPase